jgi:hypothetical protein
MDVTYDLAMSTLYRENDSGDIYNEFFRGWNKIEGDCQFMRYGDQIFWTLTMAPYDIFFNMTDYPDYMIEQALYHLVAHVFGDVYEMGRSKGAMHAAMFGVQLGE